MRSRLWSDFAAHLPMIRSFSMGNNWPPEYPQFAHKPSRYHFLFYMMVGFLERFGINIAFALNVMSALGMATLLICIYQLTQLFFGSDSKRSMLAGLLAVTFFLFNSSLTYVDYFAQEGLSLDSLAGVVKVEQFINFGPWNGDDISAFWHWNVYTNQRHLAFSFALVFIVVWPLLKESLAETKNSSKFFFLGEIGLARFLFLVVILMALPFLNLAAYAIAAFLIASWLVLNPALIKRYALPYFLAGILSLPSFYYFWQTGSGSLAFDPGFLAIDKTFLGIIYYWWRNLGLYIVLWPVLFVLANKQLKKWLLAITFYFLLANLFRLSTDMINNHKLINFFQIGFSFVLGVQLAKLTCGIWYKKVMAIVLIIPLTLSGVMDASAIVRDRLTYLNDPVHQPIGQWLLRNTSPDSVFVTTSYLYNPANLVGRKTYLDYGYFAWSMGYDTHQRRENLKQVFAPQINQSQWCELMIAQKIDFALISPGEGDLDLEIWQSWLVVQHNPAYESLNGYQVYRVSEICDNASYPL